MPLRYAQTDDALLRVRAPFASVFEHAPIGIALVGMDGRPIAANPSLVETLGYSESDLREMIFTDFTHPDDVKADWDLFAELVAGDREDYRLEKRFFRADKEVVWGKLAVSLIRDPEGRPQLAIAMVEDVTELKQAEEALRVSEDNRRGAQKMEAIGRLAGGIAHDFNNLLGVVIGSADLLQSEEGDAEKDRERVKQIRAAAERAAGLTRQLLAFARRQMLDAEVIDLNAVVDETLSMLSRLIPADIEIERRLQPELGRVSADPSQLDQVIMNLALNARDAMPDGGRLTLATTDVELSEPLPTPRVAIPAGDYVCLTVSDTGRGMDPATAAHVFEPFFTTKDPTVASGLGLSTVYGVVKQSGGYVLVDSELGRGTTFTLYLPRTEDRLPESAPPVEHASPDPATATILVVEDEQAVRDLIEELLSRLGYTVTTAATGMQALERIAPDGTGFDLVVTDLVMPSMGGAELVRLLSGRRGYPVKALFISGYSDERCRPDAGARFLQKPFSAEALAGAVREALAAPAH
jgi:PAS domain S-box-containing protein